jgi:dTDP-4-dehydrorhamnose 3,5-epimerase
MNVHTTPIEGVYLVETTPFIDQRGSFSRLFCTKELNAVVGHRQIKQINHSRTHQVGTVRGLHLQEAPFAEMKLIRCIRGGVWDVAVDLRKNSATFLKWYGVELTPANHKMLIIPEGCAHGFQVLAADSEMLYLHTAPYASSSECGVHSNDPVIAINWPLEITELSTRDANLSYINDQFTGWNS